MRSNKRNENRTEKGQRELKENPTNSSPSILFKSQPREKAQQFLTMDREKESQLLRKTLEQFG
jgi:hypothetical protein